MKLIKHTVFNLIGLGAPIVIALATIPTLIEHLGSARFGLLTLIWAVVSYFSLFDLGLGRALTLQLSVIFEKEEYYKTNPLVSTATLLLGILGTVAGILMAASAQWGVDLIKDVPDRKEAVNSVYAMALAMPFVLLTSGFRGILESRHAFGIINIIRLPMGIFTFLGPLAIVIYTKDPRLDNVAWVLVAARIIACVIHGFYAWHILPKELGGEFTFKTTSIKSLCSTGGWMTVSNVISPIMSYLDRFIIGSIISASAIAYYVTPQEIVMKLSIIPTALTSALFPALSSGIHKDIKSTIELTKKSAIYLFLVMLPTTALITLFSEKILSLWISQEFSAESTRLLQILSISMLVGTMAQIPFTLIQSANRSRTTAIIHCIEVPAFLIALWLLTTHFGLLGAAYAWSIRVLVDGIAMTFACMQILKIPLARILNRQTLFALTSSGLCFSGALIDNEMARGLWLLVFMILSLLAFTLSNRRNLILSEKN